MKRIPERLGDEVFDLCILGGGITGAGVALDAALRGLRVALIDKGDFAGGTSSISSKLVHGGLRYLEHGEFRLVYEALHERRRLLNNAPHLVQPLRFFIPFYRHNRVAPWQWRAGLLLYDLLAGPGNIQRSRAVSTANLRAWCPGLCGRDLTGGCQYFDAQMDDARLCLEVLKSASIQGACVVNYVEATGFELSGGLIRAVRARDHLEGRERVIEARKVLNATGPWGDAIRRLAGEEGPPLLRPTKGAHLVAPARDLPGAFLLLHPRDGRVFFVIPWLGKTLIGTTDSLCDDLPDKVEVSREDIDYLLEGHNHYFSPRLARENLLGHFVGLRPLLGAQKGAPSDLSREYQVVESPTGLMTVAGGKYTTYRHMAEVITDRIVARLGHLLPCRTRHHRLDGAPDEPWNRFAPAARTRLHEQYHLPSDVTEHLVQRYGRRAWDVAALLEEDSSLGQRVLSEEPDILAELRYHQEHEMAQVLADYLLRRTRLGLFHPHLLENPPAALAKACGLGEGKS